MDLRGRDYLETKDWTREELEHLLDLSTELKDKFRRGELTPLLSHKTIFLLFFDKSTRTRNAFEAGMTQLGGHAHYIAAETTQVGHGETPKDTGIILSRYGHGIAVRHDLFPGEGNRYMREVAKYADKPVINMQCDIDHPCQTLADLMTIRERLGKDLRGRKLAVTWAYAPSYAKPMSVPQGLITLMPRFGLDVVLAHPPEFKLMAPELDYARQAAAEAGVKFQVVDSMEAAFEGADVVYPKSWGCMELFKRPEESLKLARNYKHWICDEAMMRAAKADALYLHCLPADRGAEVTDAVIDGPRSVVYDQAENRLHTGKAIMAATM